MVSLNCGAMPETLLESSSSAHARRVYQRRCQQEGLLEVAEKGTIFLDEIGEMGAVMQVKLLRVLQERRFRRVGGLEELTADIRVIAATNQDLAKAVSDGRFREDLFYRINVIPSVFRRCASGARTSPCWRSTSSSKHSQQMEKRSPSCRGRRWTAAAPRLARQYPRARKCHGTRGRPRGDSGHLAR